MLLTMMTFTFIIPLIMIFMSSFLSSKKTFIDREKDPHLSVDLTLKVPLDYLLDYKFFFIAVIFLIFDVEIALLIPMISILKISKPILYISISSFFILSLLIGLYHEWNQGTLEGAI